MARALIDQMPEQVRTWLEDELIQRGFGTYSEVTDALNERLAAEGLELTVSRSSVHRYGSKVEERIAALKTSVEIARALRRQVGDDEGAMTDALVRLTQEHLFNLVLELQVDPEKVDIFKLGKVISDLTKASVMQKKWMTDYRTKVVKRLDELEQEAEDEAAKETVRRVREAIYGIEP